MEGEFPLVFSKLVVGPSGHDHTDRTECDDEDRAYDVAVGHPIDEVLGILRPL